MDYVGLWGLGIGLGTGFMVRVAVTVCRPIGFRLQFYRFGVRGLGFRDRAYG